MLVLIFSRDRAMQLDATLRSFFLRCQDVISVDVVVLFKASNPFHEAQYRQLQAEYASRVRFLPETDFRRQVLDELMSALPPEAPRRLYSMVARFGTRFAHFLQYLPTGTTPHSHVLFVVDDNIFIRDFNIGNIVRSMEEHPTALGLSLRLGENTTYCYALDVPQEPPALKSAQDDICIYSWPGASADFGYPLELSSSLYRIEEILQLLLTLPFRNPNTLEGEIAARARRFTVSHPDLLCFRKSVAFCVPVNRVQDVMKNRVGQDVHLSSERLAELFASGRRIDVQALFGFTPNACHQEVELMFEQ